MKKKFTVLTSLIFIAITLTSSGQAGLLTLEDIYSKGIYRSQGFGPARWVDGGSGYTTLERSSSGGGADIVRYDTRTGVKSVIVAANELIPAGMDEPLMIDDYSWSPDGRLMLVFTNTSRVWRYNTKGDYWVFDTVTRSLGQLGHTMPASSMMFAKFSPDGKSIAYVSN
ncbi:MAG: DPP IV N-terminal domain-containing protein, partial [Bacteroidales bacterium]|nr:DPP IV N-terminal domain-containing protein [Bacteroidales bacterium]